MSDSPEDNIVPEMERIAKRLVPSRKKIQGTSEGEPAQSQILIRATKEDHELIKRRGTRRQINVGVCEGSGGHESERHR